MCSFLVTTRKIASLTYVNAFQQRRGPDLTHCFEDGTFTYIHNLLSITGDLTPQPFIDDSCVAVFNGEIYNYNTFGSFVSDGQSILPVYKKYGTSFAQYLDGEFAICIVDRSHNTIVLSTDVFGTKPLWYAFEGGDVCVASYESSLRRLGFKHPLRLPSNTTRVYALDGTRECLEEHQVHTFALEQYKTDFRDFIYAFERSIEKRSSNLTKKIFMGLSSGYDSGAIALALEKRGTTFKIFSIEDNENSIVLSERIKRHADVVRCSLSTWDFLKTQYTIKRYAEDVYMNIIPHEGRGGFVTDNTGAVGLGYICNLARNEGYRVLFSGQGADEIFSDYGFNGKKYTRHSSFGGLFPDDLNTVFPWPNFFDGTQRAYLDKEEAIAGSYGIETRYPFLDTAVVQEFLSLSPILKNSFYKAPLHAYLKDHEYPFEDGQKIGFTPTVGANSVITRTIYWINRLWWKIARTTQRVKECIMLKIL
jgi:asparagine synthetase B (glutamine-hydrolysing)